MTSFKEFATEAAQMENQGQVKEAASAWRRAGAGDDDLSGVYG